MLDDLLGLSEPVYTPGAKLNWNGWLTGWYLDSNVGQQLQDAVRSGGKVTDVRAYRLNQDTWGDDYWKIECTLTQAMNIGQFQDYVQQCLSRAGWSHRTDGINVDYPGPGDTGGGKAGDRKDVTPNVTGGVGWWDCVTKTNAGPLNCTANALGVTPTMSAVIGGGIVLVGVLLISKLAR